MLTTFAKAGAQNIARAKEGSATRRISFETPAHTFAAPNIPQVHKPKESSRPKLLSIAEIGARFGRGLAVALLPFLLWGSVPQAPGGEPSHMQLCQSAQVQQHAQPTADTIPLTIGGGNRTARFEVEVAWTPEEQAMGLMCRRELAPNQGMLFVAEDEAQLSLWMKNTLIPLDIVFIRADRTILGIIEDAEPMTEVARELPGRSRYVLELPGGTAARIGLHAGQQVSFSLSAVAP